MKNNMTTNFEDMTRQQLVAALEKHEHRESLFNAAERAVHIGHYEWDCELDRLHACSEECASIFKLSIDELIQVQSTWEGTLQQVHPDDRADYEEHIKGLNVTKSLDIQYRIVCNDDEIRHIREIGLSVVDDTGSEARSFGMLQDITQQVEYEQELEYRERLAQQTEITALVGHYLFNEQSERYTYISPGYEKILGISSQQYMDKIKAPGDFLADVYEPDRPEVEAAFKQFMIDHKPCVQQYRLRLEDGSLCWINERNVAHKIVDGQIVHSLGVVQDITEQKEAEHLLLHSKILLEETVEARTSELASTVEQLQAEVKQRELIAAELEFLANHDALTGLPSLRLCKDRLDRSLAEARRRKHQSVVMFLDLDGFKKINDHFGHSHGDVVLKTTADRIKAALRESDTVARIGGDEFIVILSSTDVRDGASQVASSLIEQISQPIQIINDEVSVSASIGIAIYPDDGSTTESLMRQADKAMYRVKQSGKKNYCFANTV